MGVLNIGMGRLNMCVCGCLKSCVNVVVWSGCLECMYGSKE